MFFGKFFALSVFVSFNSKLVTIKGIEAECLPDPSVKSVYTRHRDNIKISTKNKNEDPDEIDLQDNIL